MNKHVLIILIILFSEYLGIAQEKILVLHGKIENSQNDSIVLSNHYGTYHAVTDNEGVFRFEETIENPDFLNFRIGNDQITIFALAGDTLQLDFNKNDFNNSLLFKGKNAELNQKLASVSSGNRAPDFSLKNLNGELVNLSDFKGKYVYIDVWNSGCRPCFKEFPAMEKLIGKYNKKNIVFIGISFDKDEKIWKKTVKKKDLKGIQLFADGWKSDFASNYFVKFNPRFILIDKNPKILFLSAPRPSGDMDKVLSHLSGIQ